MCHFVTLLVGGVTQDFFNVKSVPWLKKGGEPLLYVMMMMKTLTRRVPLAGVQDFEALQGRADSKTAFYAALTRSLGGESSRPVVKQAASWFYSLQHSASPAGYNLLSRALNNATRWALD